MQSKQQQLLNDIAVAFDGVPRPLAVTNCDCKECSDLNLALVSTTNDSVTGEQMGYSTALLSPEAFRYFLPGMARIAIKDDTIEFVSRLCTPLKKPPPQSFPHCAELTRWQTETVIALLVHVRDHSDWESGIPSKEILRGIRNWTHFLKFTV